MRGRFLSPSSASERPLAGHPLQPLCKPMSLITTKPTSECKTCGNLQENLRILASGNEVCMRSPKSLTTLFLTAALSSALFAATTVEGVGNFQKVDDHVYRGAQPT